MSSKIKTFIDHQAFSMQKYGGVSRIFAELMQYFHQDSSIEPYTLIALSDNEYLNDKNKSTFDFLFNLQLPFFKKILKILVPKWNNIYTRLKLKKEDVDVYFPSFFDTYLLNTLSQKKKILYVHDMIHELYPQWFKDKTVVENKRKWINHAEKIIAVSYHTKSDILTLYPHIDSEKIVVVHLSQSISKIENESLKSILPKHYILFVGKRKNYKNFNTLYYAFKRIKSSPEYDSLHLVCVGGGTFSTDEKHMIDNDKLSQFITQKNVLDTDLYTIYHHALVFIFPSEYEGFGIPVLEAMYSGCPVILGHFSSFPEVAEDAGIYCNTTDAIELSDTIISTISNESFRQEKIKKGIEQALKFSWEKTAKRIIDIIKKEID